MQTTGEWQKERERESVERGERQRNHIVTNNTKTYQCLQKWKPHIQGHQG